MNGHDALFSDTQAQVADFDFGSRTTAVFDDMLHRSIPLYAELQRMLGELAGEYALDGTSLYDLGCSTGITLASVQNGVQRAGKSPRLVGVDFSPPMLEQCRERFAAQASESQPTLVQADLNHYRGVRAASVVILNLTLQFIRPLYREALLQHIAAGLEQGGCLIVVEKVLSADSGLTRDFIKFYYNMKRSNGYSDSEIARKREALENVLVPYRLDENLELLRRCGFAAVDTFFRWYNFAGIIALKRTAS